MHNFREPETELTEDQVLNRKQVLHQIEDDPEAFDMRHWDSSTYNQKTKEKHNICGTVRCVAGWALHYAGTPAKYGETDGTIKARAIRALGLTYDEYFGPDSDEDTRLFYVSNAEALKRMRELAKE